MIPAFAGILCYLGHFLCSFDRLFNFVACCQVFDVSLLSGYIIIFLAMFLLDLFSLLIVLTNLFRLIGLIKDNCQIVIAFCFFIKIVNFVKKHNGHRVTVFSLIKVFS